MAIQYSGLTIRNDVHTGITNYGLLLTAINTSLVAAGWASTALAAFNNFQYTGQPVNANTLSLGSFSYTFVTVVNNATPGHVLIGASADATYLNLVAAITGGAGSGTSYATATITNTQVTAAVTASMPAGVVKISAIVTGPNGNGIGFNEWPDTVANGIFEYRGGSEANMFTAFGGYRWTSVATPALLKATVTGWLRESDSSGGVASFGSAMFILADASFRSICPTGYLRGGAFSISGSNTFSDTGATLGASIVMPSSTWRVIANGYQFFVMADTVYTRAAASESIFLGAGVPWIPDFYYPKVISAATTASPIQITTTAAHGWTTGDAVSVDGILGLTGGNVNATVTVLTATTATLGGTTGTGTYTSGGVAAKLNVGIASCAWMMGGGLTDNIPLYTSLTPTNWVGQVLNGSVNVPMLANDVQATFGAGTASLLVPSTTLNASVGDPVRWYNNDILTTEPLLSMGESNLGTGFLVGQLWDAFFHSKAEAGGTLGVFDSKNWYILTNNATGSSTTKEGALVLRVP